MTPRDPTEHAPADTSPSNLMHQRLLLFLGLTLATTAVTTALIALPG